MRPHVICLIVLIGCQPSAAGEPQPAPPSVRFEHDMMVRAHMYENFDVLRAIEKLAVRGNLEEARAMARAIADAPDEPSLSAWATQAALVRDRASTIVHATTVNDACRRAADLAEACAGCHVAAGVVPEFKPPARTPPDQPTLAARMARHVWATDRLWEGMVGGDDDSWRQGLDVLAAAPLTSPAIAGERIGIARRLQQLADQARRQPADAPPNRTHTYAEILVTCASCHAARPSENVQAM